MLESIANLARHSAPGIGHNQPPKRLYGLGSLWLHFANEYELRRLAVLHLRMERKKAGIAEITAECALIGGRCAKRMRRQRGLN